MDSVLSTLLEACVFGALLCLGVVGLQIRVMGTDAFGRVGKMILFAGLVFLLLSGGLFGLRRVTHHDRPEPATPADTGVLAPF